MAAWLHRTGRAAAVFPWELLPFQWDTSEGASPSYEKLGLYGFKMEQDASSKTIEQSLKNMLYRASYVGRVWADQVPLSQLVPMKRQAWADEFFT